MKISQLIKKLQEQLNSIGDKTVFVSKFDAKEEEAYLHILEVKKNKPYHGITILVD